jgi:hypothetical protein
MAARPREHGFSFGACVTFCPTINWKSGPTVISALKGLNESWRGGLWPR